MTSLSKTPRRTAAVAVVVAALVGVGAAGAAAPKVVGNPANGKKVFISTGCGVCHTLKATKAVGVLSKNLDKTKPAYAKIVSSVTNGMKGKIGIMTAYKNVLSKTQIQDVAAFVYTSTHP